MFMFNVQRCCMSSLSIHSLLDFRNPCHIHATQFLPKDKVDWAYATTATPEQDDWILTDKNASSAVPAGVEKKIGFEGKPDTATGFYCNYKGGRLVDKYDEGKSLAKE